ncbi:DUF5348 domain-containing protein [Pectinatus frisingensis]|uniref:DUF5348 domain-containing protein n=1 Tax=Pectinatus frisingensis TaxID=865 RepID=UPI0018C6C6C8|nr:DUF5348 domain-containing protein [Pectinatus frisingensis]
MLRHGMIERFKKAAPIIQELIEDLAWIQNEFNPEHATEEERTYVMHLLGLGSNCFDESDWRLKRMLAAIGKQGRLIRNSSGRFEMEGTDIEFTCGSSCEVYAPYFSDEEEWMTWLPTSIEYSSDYYFTARPDMKLEGALVRVKGR